MPTHGREARWTKAMEGGLWVGTSLGLACVPLSPFMGLLGAELNLGDRSRHQGEPMCVCVSGFLSGAHDRETAAAGPGERSRGEAAPSALLHGQGVRSPPKPLESPGAGPMAGAWGRLAVGAEQRSRGHSPWTLSLQDFLPLARG